VRRRAPAEPDLDERAAGDAVALVVAEPVGALDDEFAPHAGGVGQARDLRGVVARHARRGLKHEAGRRARRHQGRLGTQHARDGGASRRIQLVDVDQRLRGLAHGLDGLRPHDRAPVPRGGAGAVDDGRTPSLSYTPSRTVRVPMRVAPPLRVAPRGVRDLVAVQ